MTPEEKIAILEEKIAQQDANLNDFAISRNHLKNELDTVTEEAQKYRAALEKVLWDPYDPNHVCKAASEALGN